MRQKKTEKTLSSVDYDKGTSFALTVAFTATDILLIEPCFLGVTDTKKVTDLIKKSSHVKERDFQLATYKISLVWPSARILIMDTLREMDCFPSQRYNEVSGKIFDWLQEHVLCDVNDVNIDLPRHIVVINSNIKRISGKAEVTLVNSTADLVCESAIIHHMKSSKVNDITGTAKVLNMDAGSEIGTVSCCAEVENVEAGATIENVIGCAKIKNIASGVKIMNFNSRPHVLDKTDEREERE